MSRVSKRIVIQVVPPHFFLSHGNNMGKRSRANQNRMNNLAKGAKGHNYDPKRVRIDSNTHTAENSTIASRRVAINENSDFVILNGSNHISLANITNSSTQISSTTDSFAYRKVTIEEIEDLGVSQVNPLRSDEYVGLLFVPSDLEAQQDWISEIHALQQREKEFQVDPDSTLYRDADGTLWDIKADEDNDPWVYTLHNDNLDLGSDISESEDGDYDIEMEIDDEDEPEDTDDEVEIITPDPEVFQPTQRSCNSWDSRKPPTILEARLAIKDLDLIFKPPHVKGHGHKECLVPLVTRTRLEHIREFLNLYQLNDHSKYSKAGEGHNESCWMASSLATAQFQGSSKYRAKNLWKWVKAYCTDRSAWPVPLNPNTKRSTPIDDPDISAAIALHLQSIGKYVRAMDIVQYLSNSAVQKNLGIKKAISLATAQRWMKKMGYRWTKKPSGQYIDGHEHADVVYYRQQIFLPAWAELD